MQNNHLEKILHLPEKIFKTVIDFKSATILFLKVEKKQFFKNRAIEI